MINDLSLVSYGAGGFLNPPFHPEHTHCFHSRDMTVSLSCVLSEEWFSKDIKAQAQRLLDNWEKSKLPLDNPEVIKWVRHVLGYFKSCYQNPETKSWNADEVLIDSKRNPMRYVNEHCGVHFIRGFYPEYQPSKEDFGLAKWGN